MKETIITDRKTIEEFFQDNLELLNKLGNMEHAVLGIYLHTEESRRDIPVAAGYKLADSKAGLTKVPEIYVELKKALEIIKGIKID